MKANHGPLLSLRNLAIDGFPIFNIGDGMSFIYIVCATDVKTQLGAELHLYQFRMIIKSLRDWKGVIFELRWTYYCDLKLAIGDANPGPSHGFCHLRSRTDSEGDNAKCSSTRLYDGLDRKIQERVYQKECAICSESSRKLSRVFDLARRLSSSGKYKLLCFNKNLESALRYPLYRKQCHAKDTYRSVVARSQGKIFKSLHWRIIFY